ncbi:site-specific DNA-methyltransferase [Fictibacillus barbaricus]|uniref:Site-specific DNA-methyltransferase n=1 Tax=Fictibacillus barbaricus TaxID=182136 RepID=A0ABS2ZB77_9BACL|nr:site-specific DNA-methyltransferase [Fictibacillus barbaricus]MBN3543919.1 site-specific DNA-methyltransferase [Fictibacillus barbaricus]GGB71734.1 site-specific DNA-methyltransferase [Fictibacillus barbaricus]
MPILNFKGKSFVQNHHYAVKYHQLVPDKDKSLTNKVSLNDNLIIHGDNLKALKALLPTYAGRVKCIYIDPPYNTGNEGWVYNDNVNSPMIQSWLGDVVDKDDLSRHDKWLCMMMPRLKLLKELLSEDGVIFASIDDNEVHNLRALMDEVFDENNFIGQISVINNLKGRSDDRYFATAHEFLLVYRKSTLYDTYGLPIPEEYQEEYTEIDDDGEYFRLQGLRKRGAGSKREDRPEMYYPFYYNPDTEELSLTQMTENDVEITPKLSSGEDGRWRWGKLTAQERIDELMVRLVGGRNEYDVFQKDFMLLGGDLKKVKPKSIWLKKSHSSDAGTKSYKEVMGNKTFQNPKSPYLIKDIIKQSTKDGDIILDSFAGSGTTGQAVLELNKEDETERKFILVEMEEYTNEVTAERVRRVIKGVPKSRNENIKAGLGGTFSYFQLGDPIEMEAILHGEKLPSYEDLARYIFYTATGEEFDPECIDTNRNFIGESKEYEVYMFYQPDLAYLRTTSLNLEVAKNLGEYTGKQRLVFAPMKYLDQEYLLNYRIEYSQLPFEIYRLKD